MTTLRTTIILLTCVAFAAAASAQIVNGSFEPASTAPGYLALPGGSTTIPGWTTTDTGVEWYDPMAYGVGAAPSGDYAVDLANYVYSTGGIEQTFATIPGTMYEITFWLGTSQSSGRVGTCEIVVAADGATQLFTAENYNAVKVWELKTFAFMADDASATLSFRCLQNANQHFADIDGVGLAGTVAADEASWSDVKSLFR